MSLKNQKSMIGIAEVLNATGGTLLYGEPDGFYGLAIDSRTIKEGEFFVAIKGERFDGHEFINEALTRGAGAIVSIPPFHPLKGRVFIHVQNTVKALQDIARFIRMKSTAKVAGITGSNGKTTTKELLASMLGRRHSVLKNPGNLNNHIGLPLALSRLRQVDQCAVLEMGASARGDIDLLCSIARPDIAVLTNIGEAHLEGFGSIETVLRSKLEILRYAQSAVINIDDKRLQEGVDGYKGRVVTCAIDQPADVMARNIRFENEKTRFELCIAGLGSIEAALGVSGIFNVRNAICAAGAALLFGLGLEDMAQGIGSFKGVPLRYEQKTLGSSKVILDAYNANPSSMREALTELLRTARGPVTAVLGDMLELGLHAKEAHMTLGAWMARSNVDRFIAVGELMALAADTYIESGGAYALKAENATEAGELLKKYPVQGETILVKGSRGLRMEEVLTDAL